MAKSKLDNTLVEAILAGQHPTASAWLQGRGRLDALPADLALCAIEVAVRQQRGELLDAVSQSANDKQLRKAAAAGLHRLKSMGVAVTPAARQTIAWTPRADLNTPPPPVALLGYPDPNGYFPFILVAYGPGEACASLGLAGAGQGFSEADHGHLSRSDARDMIRRSQQDQNLHEVPFHVGLHFVQRAFAEARSGQPHGFEHMLESVPEGLRTSARILDPLEGQEQTLEVDALHAVDPLLDPQNGLFLALSQEDAYKALIQVSSAVNSPLELGEDGRLHRAREAIDQAADDYLTETARRTWTLALDVVTFLAWRADKEDVRKAARHNALALRTAIPGRDVPFVRQWINTQLFSMMEMFFANQGGAPINAEATPAESSGIILTDR